MQYEGKVENTLMLWLLLNHVYNESRDSFCVLHSLCKEVHKKKSLSGSDGLLQSGSPQTSSQYMVKIIFSSSIS